MILVGNTGLERVLVAIEAKVDELFGSWIGEYLESSVQANPRSRVPDRIEQLSKSIFGHTNVSDIRYQLLHAVAGTLIEAVNQNASIAVLVIHEFVPIGGKSAKAKENDKDLIGFIEKLSNESCNLQKGHMIGPFNVPGSETIPNSVPLYIGKIETAIEGSK